MIVFNELRITRDAKSLIIKVSKSKLSYFSKVLINSIYVVNEEILENKNILVEDVTISTLQNEFSNFKVFNSNEGAEEAEVVISQYYNLFSSADVPYNEAFGSFDKHLWFVFVVTNELYDAANAPCELTKNPQVGVTMYPGDIYNNFMAYIKQMAAGNCTIPKDMIDQLLRYKAITTAIDSGHYSQGIDYYNRWIKHSGSSVPSNNCGCNG